MLMDRTIIVDGFDLCNGYGLVLESKELGAPDPKTYLVDVPYRNGSIDLTEAILGDVTYKDRKQSFRLVYARYEVDEDSLMTDIMGRLHGRRMDYRLSWDPSYTYTGRFRVSFDHDGANVGVIDIDVTADPYKRKDPQVYEVNANGGIMLRLESGRLPVCPVFTCTNPTEVECGGFRTMLPQGTYRCPDIVFKQGWNAIYLNSWNIRKTLWSELSEDGGKALTWEQAGELRWYELQQVGEGLDSMRAATWADLRWNRWGEFADKAWSTISYVPVENEGLTPRPYKTTVRYDWADL